MSGKGTRTDPKHGPMTLGRVCGWALGLFALLRLAAQTRFRLKGAYWTWRQDTAFGNGQPASKLVSVLDYGAWVHRMRTKG